MTTRAAFKILMSRPDWAEKCGIKNPNTIRQTKKRYADNDFTEAHMKHLITKSKLFTHQKESWEMRKK